MTISYETFSKTKGYYTIVFSKCMEIESNLIIRFKPHEDDNTIFSKDNIDLSRIKMRDAETILSIFGDYGMTLILKGAE